MSYISQSTFTGQSHATVTGHCHMSLRPTSEISRVNLTSQTTVRSPSLSTVMGQSDPGAYSWPDHLDSDFWLELNSASSPKETDSASTQRGVIFSARDWIRTQKGYPQKSESTQFRLKCCQHKSIDPIPTRWVTPRKRNDSKSTKYVLLNVKWILNLL